MKKSELMEALDVLEKERHIRKNVILGAIKESLIKACKNHFGNRDNFEAEINEVTGEFSVFAKKTVVEMVEDDVTEISLGNAQMFDSNYQLGDVVRVPIESKNFGRIATQNAKSIILQKIREEEQKSLIDKYHEYEREVMSAVVQRYAGKNITVTLQGQDNIEAVLSENEQVKDEFYQLGEMIKVYILEVKDSNKGPRIMASRTHPDLVKRLFEAQVSEVSEGTVEIKSIAREAGSRTKMAVMSHNPDVDAVGSCVGLNSDRVALIVDELRGEKIDIVEWDENPAKFIENSLSPAKVVSVLADPDENIACVVVPDYQLSLAIGKEGQNARLAARLTGYKIDIKSESQMEEYMQEMEDEDEEDVSLYEDDMDEYVEEQ